MLLQLVLRGRQPAQSARGRTRLSTDCQVQRRLRRETLVPPLKTIQSKTLGTWSTLAGGDVTCLKRRSVHVTLWLLSFHWNFERQDASSNVRETCLKCCCFRATLKIRRAKKKKKKKVNPQFLLVVCQIQFHILVNVEH